MRGVEAVQSLGKLVASQASYYIDQLRHSVGEDVPVLRGEANASGRADYYAGHESPSRWMGSGLDRLDLGAGAPVDPEEFAGLMSHRTPEGEVMSVTRSHGRVAAFDHTFSAPKSVSLLYAFGDDEIRTAVVAAHRKAVFDAVGYMEERCSQSRVGRRYTHTDGISRFTTRQVPSEGYVAAGFDHYTSRANDPQVHTHVVVINRVYAEGGWRAIDAKSAYAHLKAGGTIYQSTLREELTRRLGVRWQRVQDGMADVAGFSPELVRHFSTRRVEIEAAVERYVSQSGKDAHPRVWQTFTLETRQPKTYPRGESAVTQEMKDYGISTDVIGHWEKQAVAAPEDVRGVIRNAVRVATPSRHEDRVMDSWTAKGLVEKVADRQAVFTERDLLPEIATLHPEGTTPYQLVTSARRLLDMGLEFGDVVRVLPHRGLEFQLPNGIELSDDELAILHYLTPQTGPFADISDRVLPGEARYTTRVQLDREGQVLDAVTTRSPVAVDRDVLEAAISDRRLVGVQAEAVRHLADLDNRVVTLVGPGGSGKTHAIGAYTDAAQATGHHVVGVAASATAARRIGDELPGSWSGTIAMMRHQLDLYNSRLPEGSVIVVDEASMVSTRDLAWLVSQAEDCDGKIVLVGDPKQLPSIDSGGLFHRIVADGDGVVADLAGVNHRQTLNLDRQALHQLRQGEVESAVHDYAEAGRIHLGHDEYATKAAMVDTWWKDVQTHAVDQVRMLASTRDEVAMLNQLARVHMRAEGHLGGPVFVNRWGTEFQSGDRIVVRDNWYAHSDLRNGQTGTITEVHPDTGCMAFSRDVDCAVIELPASYMDSSVDHAYAQTIHTAQGQTFHTTHLYVDTGMAAEHGYTGLSRARDETHLWVNISRTIDGRCIQSHGQSAVESQVESLVRQLTRSVVQLPASSQGLAIEIATDQQLHHWRQQLEDTLRNSPLAHRLDHDLLAGLDKAVVEAGEVADRIDTSGARSQVERLEEHRQQLVARITERERWIEDNVDTLHAYIAVKDELHARTTAVAITYQLHPPGDLIDALGPRPAGVPEAMRWDATAVHHAEARLRLGPDADLTDPSVLESAQWRDAISSYNSQPELNRTPVLQLVG